MKLELGLKEELSDTDVIRELFKYKYFVFASKAKAILYQIPKVKGVVQDPSK